jgi:very-short-patch-repair endonuclease
MARDIHGAIAGRAPKSLGLFTNGQLDALGVSRQQRRTLLSKGVLIPMGGGVVRHAAHPTSWQQRILAAVLAAGEGAVASHRSAAALWRLDGMEHADTTINVTVARGRCPRSVPATVHRSLDLRPVDIEPRQLIPRTTAARTLLDIAPHLPLRQLEAVLDDAERRGLTWRPHLRWRIEELRRCGRPGVPAMADLLDRTEGRPLGDSWLEQAAIRHIVGSGLPVPRVQVKQRTAGGGIARVDLFWDAARLVVELAGHGTHATRRQRQSDAERAARLGLGNWTVVEFTYEDVVERPEYVVDMIRAYLRKGGQER